MITEKILLEISEFVQEKDLHVLKEKIDKIILDYEIVPKTTALTVYEPIPRLVKIYLMEMKLKNRSEATIRGYANVLFRVFDAIRKPPEDIDQNDIKRFLITQKMSSKKQSTINTLVSVLRSFFTYLHDNEYIKTSPMKTIHFGKTEQRLHKFIPQEDLEKIRLSINDLRSKALLEFAYSTGCRVSEIMRVNVVDINWSTGSLNVIGKGNKQRTVFLNPRSKVCIKQYVESRKDTNVALFVSERVPFNRIGVRAIQEVFEKIGKDSKYPQKIHPHIMRHSMATTMVNNGANITDIQNILGHSSPSTTMVYAELNTATTKRSHSLYLS